MEDRDYSRARKATTIAMWFSAAFALLFCGLALLNVLGVTGVGGDAPQAALMAAGGAIVAGGIWLALRLG